MPCAIHIPLFKLPRRQLKEVRRLLQIVFGQVDIALYIAAARTAGLALKSQFPDRRNAKRGRSFAGHVIMKLACGAHPHRDLASSAATNTATFLSPTADSCPSGGSAMNKGSVQAVQGLPHLITALPGP